jgi:hypothetical protein
MIRKPVRAAILSQCRYAPVEHPGSSTNRFEGFTPPSASLDSLQMTGVITYRRHEKV